MPDPQHPAPDDNREDRIIDDVMALLKLRTAMVPNGASSIDPRDNVRRWLKHTLVKASRSSRLPWWFTKRHFVMTVYPGQDVFDIKGKVDRLIGIHGKAKLKKESMEWIAQQRGKCQDRSNSGEPLFYCEYGGRLHLFPAPANTMTLSVLYTEPMTCACVPDEWESILLDGVIGLYARHFDSSGLREGAEEFASRFWQSLKEYKDYNHDANLHYRNKPHTMETTSTRTLSGLMAEMGANNPDDSAILTPSLQGQVGQIQILSDDPENSQPSAPVAQIPGEHQP